MSRAIITNGFERGRGAILSMALAFPQHRIAIYDPPGGAPYIPPLIEPVFPDPPGGGEWDPDGGTVGGDPITYPGAPGTDAPWLVPDPGPVTLSGATFVGGPTTCVGWRFELCIGRDLCTPIPSAAANNMAALTVTIGTVDGGDVIVSYVLRYDGAAACNSANAGANWSVQSYAITGGTHAADWTGSNCKGNGNGVLTGATVPTGQAHECCPPPQNFSRAVWRYNYNSIFRTGGGANASAISARFDFSGACAWGFGHFSIDLT